MRQCRDGLLIAITPLVVTLQHVRGARIVETDLRSQGFRERLGQRRDVAQCEIESLTCNGMEVYGRAAYEHRTGANNGIAAHATQRVSNTLTNPIYPT